MRCACLTHEKSNNIDKYSLSNRKLFDHIKTKMVDNLLFHLPSLFYLYHFITLLTIITIFFYFPLLWLIYICIWRNQFLSAAICVYSSGWISRAETYEWCIGIGILISCNKNRILAQSIWQVYELLVLSIENWKW